ncbi:MAG: DUF3800 domain-containing protein [Corynebacterium sp.]|uniref:DUF3800 domain-containing protein n=1 Tax=Corynebacterium sp. TaxID=1720 RepID=UPI003F0AF588
MLLAYLDEIGHTGAFVSTTHNRYADSPAFGYGGFVIPVERAREFGANFAAVKKRVFRSEIPDNEDPGRWEKKGANLLFAKVPDERPQNIRVLGGLIKSLRKMEGSLFYYADEKPLGTPKEVNSGSKEYLEREAYAMTEALNRLARHAQYKAETIMVMMDQVNEKSRKKRLPEMYAHILGRASEHPEMRRIIEPPMHIDSELSSNIQFADWVCALVKRAIEYQLVENSRYHWVPQKSALGAAKGAFTHESKLHLYRRSISDLNHSEIMYTERPVVESKSKNIKPEDRAKLERVLKASFN